jgi:hypothetical protein
MLPIAINDAPLRIVPDCHKVAHSKLHTVVQWLTEN